MYMYLVDIVCECVDVVLRFLLTLWRNFATLNWSLAVGDRNSDGRTDSTALTLAEGHWSCHLARLNYLDVW